MAATTGRESSAAMNGAAKAASVDRPTAGLPVARAIPRAAAIPTRSPVKLPGPVVTAIRSRSVNSSCALCRICATSGIKASACPRCISKDSCTRRSARAVSSTATEQASSAVSMARTRIPDCSTKSRRDRREGTGLPAIHAFCRVGETRKQRSHRADFDHVRYEVAQQVLDAVLEGRGRGRAARAGPLHVEIDNAFLVATEGDVAAVTGDGRAHARLDQILDGGNGLRILGVEKFLRRRV